MQEDSALSTLVLDGVKATWIRDNASAKLMPVVYNAAAIGVTRESNDAIDKFKRNLIRKHCREFRPMEVLYELNLFYPFSLLLNWGIYRHHILYKYANLIKLYYKIWGRWYL